MHFAAAAAVSLLLITPCLFAAPTSSSQLVIPSQPIPAHASFTPSFSSSLSHHRSVKPSHYLPRPSAGTNPPHPVDMPPPSPSPYDLDSNVQQRQKTLTIALGVIAGFISFGFLVCIIRCIYMYKAPPKRDRIAEILQRHNLQCELEELERNPYALRRPSRREPAPPYSPRPPSYTESVMGTGRAEETAGLEQTEIKASQHAVPFTQSVHPSG